MPSRSTSPGLFAESSAKPPSTGWITAHCDGGARGNPGPSGYGAEITDADGNVLAELSEFLGIRTNNYAEYAGLLASLAWALEHGHRRLRVISDSELMVKQIQGKYKVNSPDLKPLWQEARSRIARLEAFEITHALRHKNKAADALANQAMDRGMNRTLSPGPGSAKLQEDCHPSRSGGPASRLSPPPKPQIADPKPGTMLRGFTRDGVVHLLGSATLPDGIFVKVIPE
jgi:ribonuclease HI